MTESGFDDTAEWLYAVAADAPPPGPEVPGVAGEDVRAVHEAGLTALVGAVPLREFGQPAVRRNLENVDWLAAVARAHDAVVRAAMRSGPVIPARLLTLFSDEAAIRALLRPRGPDLVAALRKLAGRAEWEVKVFGDPRAAGSLDEAPEADGARPGASYLLRRRAALTERERSLRDAGEFGERLHHRLATMAVAEHRHGVRGTIAPETPGTLLRNDAYLVEDKRFEAFHDAVRADPGRAHVRVELTGPWPPYSFATVPD